MCGTQNTQSLLSGQLRGGSSLGWALGETWTFFSVVKAAAVVGLLALLMGRRGLDVAFNSMVGDGQAFPCFSGKALQCRWLRIYRAELGRGELVIHQAPDLLLVA